MDFITFIIFLGIVQGFLVGILLLTLKRGNIQANHLLGILMILFSISISGFLLERTSLYRVLPFLIEVPSTVVFLFGPLFYFYVLTLTAPPGKNKLRKKSLLHFIPFFLLILFNLPFYLSSPEEKMMSERNQLFSMADSTIVGLQTIHVLAYMFFIKKILKEYEFKIKSTLSSIENINLKWLKLTIYLFTFIFGLIAIFLVLSLSGVNINYFFNTIIPLLAALGILGLGYWGFRQPIIFPAESDSSKNKKYEWSTLTDEKADDYLNKLKLIMHEEKPYLDSSLTLQKLADMIGITPQHLSQTINEKMNQNFFDFVNCYRIKEAKRLLVDPRGELLTILAIAEEVGFNSKSSFNTAFKKITGMTPTEYKKSLSPDNL
jgi:AraC-like DNA-binding protein